MPFERRRLGVRRVADYEIRVVIFKHAQRAAAADQMRTQLEAMLLLECARQRIQEARISDARCRRDDQNGGWRRFSAGGQADNAYDANAEESVARTRHLLWLH